MPNPLVNQLNSALQSIVTGARLSISPCAPLNLKLWLIDPSTMQRPFSPQETQRLLDAPPYWCFCWASGLALDLLAVLACRANAELNQLALSYSADLFSETQPYDILFAADVLYDAENLPLLQRFPEFAKHLIVADSRQRDFQHPLLQKTAVLHAQTQPDLAEPEEFRQVSLYQSIQSLA